MSNGQISQQSAVEANTLSGFMPDPYTYDTGETNPNKQDSAKNLITRSSIHCDEGSFRHTFVSTSIINITGIVYFTNGSNVVTGNGTSFTTELNTDMYLRLSTHSLTSAVLIVDVISDTEVRLQSAYQGATGNGTATRSLFQLNYSGTGAGVTFAANEAQIASGTSSGGYVVAYRDCDYLPLIGYGDLDVSQRIVNNEVKFGFMDTFIDGETPNAQAVIVFDGTSDTRIKFRTSRESGVIQETSVMLPKYMKSSEHLDWMINVLPDSCILVIEGKEVARHTDSIPGPYDFLYMGVLNKNTGAVASSTTSSISSFYLANYNVVQIANSFTGNPIPTRESKPPGGFSDGQRVTAATTTVQMYATTYTEQTSNAQRSLKSASANDAAAGTGARKVRIVYYTSAYAGPFTEIVTLNGTTAVATVATDICFIERMEVITAGSLNASSGVISLYANNAGTGTVVWSIPASSTKNFGAHHYVAAGKTCKVSSISFCTNSTTSGNGALFFLTARDGMLTDSVEQQVSDTLSIPGNTPQTSRPYVSPIEITGPAFIRAWVKPYASASYTNFCSFDFTEE